MINFIVRVTVEILLAFVLGIVYSLLEKNLFKGIKGRMFLLYIIALTIVIVLFGIYVWIMLKNLNVNI